MYCRLVLSNMQQVSLSRPWMQQHEQVSNSRSLILHENIDSCFDDDEHQLLRWMSLQTTACLIK